MFPFPARVMTASKVLMLWDFIEAGRWCPRFTRNLKKHEILELLELLLTLEDKTHVASSLNTWSRKWQNDGKFTVESTY